MRNKAYDVTGEPSSYKQEQIDEMIRTLFEELDALSASGGSGTGSISLVNTAAAYLTLVGSVLTTALINLASHVTGRLPYANLVAATAASKLVGRQSGSAGDFGEITLGTGLSMSGSTLNASGESHTDGYWTPLSDGDLTQPEVVFDSNGDVIMVWVVTP